MIRSILFFILTCFFALNVSAETNNSDQAITLKLPESLMAEAVKKSLPFEIDTSSQTIGGSVFVKSIENLQLEDQNISALLVLAGKDIQITTKIAGQKLRLKIGDVALNFNISASIRFDEPSQTLFLKPNVTEYKSAGNKKGGEIGILLIGLLNGKEFPIEIKKMQPLITDLGSKQLAIELKIKDITIKKDILLLNLTPDVKSLPVKKA